MCAAGLYLLLISSTVSLVIKLRHATTGLKWDPASLASQLTLLTYFDPYDFFIGLEHGGWHIENKTDKQIRRQLTDWGLREFGALRLGYWRHRPPGTVVHGIRILPHRYSKFFAGDRCIDTSQPISSRQVSHTRVLSLSCFARRTLNLGESSCSRSVTNSFSPSGQS